MAFSSLAELNSFSCKNIWKKDFRTLIMQKNLMLLMLFCAFNKIFAIVLKGIFIVVQSVWWDILDSFSNTVKYVQGLDEIFILVYIYQTFEFVGRLIFFLNDHFFLTLKDANMLKGWHSVLKVYFSLKNSSWWKYFQKS